MPWRKACLRYAHNEILFDVIKEINSTTLVNNVFGKNRECFTIIRCIEWYRLYSSHLAVHSIFAYGVRPTIP
ncbi:hypothetical protein V8B97DRAFT_155413 [Scleroderma yunnanense]